MNSTNRGRQGEDSLGHSWRSFGAGMEFVSHFCTICIVGNHRSQGGSAYNQYSGHLVTPSLVPGHFRCGEATGGQLKTETIYIVARFAQPWSFPWLALAKLFRFWQLGRHTLKWGVASWK